VKMCVSRVRLPVCAPRRVGSAARHVTRRATVRESARRKASSEGPIAARGARVGIAHGRELGTNSQKSKLHSGFM
jgi:hypothetical protein